MRKAIALIELIFAIVIIAITLISVPNLVATTSKASSNAITQEAISNASSYIDLIMSSFWDENAVNVKLENPIVYVTKEDNALKEAKNGSFLTGKRVGSPKETSRRYKNAIGTTSRVTATLPSKLGFETAETTPNDIDDFNNRAITLTPVEATSVTEGDYKDKTVQISTTIKYNKDTPTKGVGYKDVEDLEFKPFQVETGGSTNIKEIQVTLTSTNNNKKKVILRAFSCNIGSSKLKERKF
jgi:type II secretory pathway pseudopilin PulG